MTEKVFISPQRLYEDSLELGRQIIASGFKPDFIVGVWRGGTPVGITVQELLDFYGIHTDHISIRTSSYSGLDARREGRVRVHGLGYLEQQMNAEDSLLIVDDVFDTGLSVKAIIAKLKRRARKNLPKDLRVATAYYKPGRNRTSFEPDFSVHRTDDWLVFPHEMEGLSLAEIREYKSHLATIIDALEGVAEPVKLARE